MKILVIGATGTIGSAVVKALAGKHEVISASRKGNPTVDLDDPASLAALFASVKGLSHVISCAGSGAWKPLAQLTDEDFAYSLRSKLMGQVNIIRQALQHVADGGSVTVTSGVLAQHAMPGSAAISMVNAGLEGFVRGAALDATRGVRVNVVSPGWVKETMIAMKMDPTSGMAAVDVAKAYVAAVEGKQHGATISPSALG
jgi:NAD(P)-dependent dehydrogenase (short-subunit alcohol dehydrogenase family)